VIFAALIAQPLKSEGFTLSYPIGSLIVLLVLAALAGVLAAVLPARRASRPRRAGEPPVRVGLERSGPAHLCVLGRLACRARHAPCVL